METKIEESDRHIKVPISVFDEVIKALEDYAEIIDGEWGSCRSAKKLIEIGRMPNIYYELLKLKQK